MPLGNLDGVGRVMLVCGWRMRWSFEAGSKAYRQSVMRFVALFGPFGSREKNEIDELLQEQRDCTLPRFRDSGVDLTAIKCLADHAWCCEGVF